MGRNTKFQNRRVRKNIGVTTTKWYNRQGIVIDRVPEFICEMARVNGKRLPPIKADLYAEAFERAAIDLGDDGIPFSAANALLGRPNTLRWPNSGRGDEIFGYHPMNQAHKQIMTTTFAHIDEIGEIYERQLREKSS